MHLGTRVREIMIGTGVAATLLVGAVGAVGPASPASADIGSCAISGNSAVGIIGQLQVLNINNCNDAQNVLVTFANGSAQTVPVFNGAGTIATANWTPNQIGIASLALQGATGTTGTLASSNIQRTPTTVTISAPNTTQVGVPTQVTVTVQSQSPSAYQPTGTVTVRDGNGATITTMGLTPGTGTGQSFAYWRWTPPTTGTFIFQASYSGDTNAVNSQSPVDVVSATPSGNTISLAAPGTMTQGVPVVLTATVIPWNVQGSVGFTLNGQPISASVPLINGVATFTWTPSVVGQVTLGANYMTNGGRSGSTSDPVTIVPGPVSVDVITLTQPGFGTWAPNGVYTLGNGTTFTFQASTLSGAAVVLKNTGACTNTGLTLTIPQGSGTCNLVATSPGGPGYAPVSQGYTVSMVPGRQTATLAAPNSGNFSTGRTIRLQNPAQGRTNAGQTVHWRVTSGGSRCRITYPSNGAVNVQLRKRGQCTVVATAAAVPNQWASFRLQRTYTAR
jgi:hypothetical protein